ncbi:MAG: hypothetical protein HFI86_02040 [Bacilli bacterium]|nr:hypothetical protein [Bacilli bacterium]
MMCGCKNLCCRHKKGIIYFFCKKNNTEISLCDCKCCLLKEYKKYKNINDCKHKHRITKYTAIKNNIKEVVWERDDHKCIFCGKTVPKRCANSHYVKRSHLGMGLEENLFTACDKCHEEYDDSIKRKWLQPIAKDYLKKMYGNWSEKNLVYRKYGD